MRRPFAMTAAQLFVLRTWCISGFALEPDQTVIPLFSARTLSPAIPTGFRCGPENEDAL